MSIYHYPDYLKFIKNERKTLEFISSQTYLRKTFRSLAECAEISFHNLPIKDSLLRNSEFTFGCDFDILIEKEVRRIAIEANLKPGFSIVSYVLSICENKDEPFSLIRKFHFDYAIPNSSEETKPVYHLQFGGKPTPQLKKLKTDPTALHPWLSTPRISFYPVNLALLLDMVFSEFISEETASIVGRSEWRDFIKNNEENILKPFYQKIHHFLINDHGSDFLLRDFYYGETN